MTVKPGVPAAPQPSTPPVGAPAPQPSGEPPSGEPTAPEVLATAVEGAVNKALGITQPGQNASHVLMGVAKTAFAKEAKELLASVDEKIAKPEFGDEECTREIKVALMFARKVFYSSLPSYRKSEKDEHWSNE